MKDVTFPSSYGVESSWVVAENKRPGTNAWRITKGASPDIAGYASTTYAAEGSKVTLYVTTPAARFASRRTAWATTRERAPASSGSRD